MTESGDSFPVEATMTGLPRPIRALHLSDTQYGKYHRFGRNDGTAGDKNYDRLVSRIFDDLESFLEPVQSPTDSKVLNLVDLVIVSGDLVEQALDSEFEQLSGELKWLAERLKIPLRRVVVVPGNHDVSWLHARHYFEYCEINGVRPALPYPKKWEPYASFFKSFYRGEPDAPSFTGDQPWSWYEFPDLDLAVAGLNSTMAESHRETDHYGQCGEEQYRWFADQLEQSECSTRLAVLHHNPIRLATGNNDNLRDADVLDRFLGKKVDVFLHGHLHNLKMSKLASGALVLATGSAAHVPPRLDPVPTNWEVASDYQVLELASGMVKQYARRFEPSANRWIGDTRIGVNEWTVTHDAASVDRHPARNKILRQDRGSDRVRSVPSVRELLAAEVAGLEEIRSGDGVSVKVEHRENYSVVRVSDSYGSKAIGIAENFQPDAVRLFNSEIVQPRKAFDADRLCEFVYSGARLSVIQTAEYEEQFATRIRNYRSYLDLVDLDAFEKSQRDWMLQRPEYHPALYVEQWLKGNPRSGVAPDPQGRYQALPYLTSGASRRGLVTIVLADSGAGKTFLFRQFCESVTQLSTESRRVPIFVELARLEKTTTLVNAVTNVFMQRGVDATPSVVRNLLRHDRLVVVLDGYDELAVRSTFEDAARSVDTLLSGIEVEWLPEILLSSRQTHVENNGHLIGRLNGVPHELVYVDQFNDSQIREALKNLLRQEGPLGTVKHDEYLLLSKAQEFVDQLKRLPNLFELATNPRLMRYLFDLRSQLAEIENDRAQDFTRAAAYRLITDRWLIEDKRKNLAEFKAIGEMPFDTAKKLVRMVAVFAWELQDSMTTDDVSRLLATTRVTGWTTDQLVQFVLTRTFFSRVDDQYSFTHRSILEFLIADMANDAADGRLSPSLSNRLDTSMQAIGPSTLVIDLLAEITRGNNQKMEPVVARWEASSLLTSLRAALNLDQDSNFLEIENSSQDLSSRNWENTTHIRCSYRGSVLPTRSSGATFIDCDLESAVAKGSDLRNSQFKGGSVSYATFLGANLAGASFTSVKASYTNFLWAHAPRNMPTPSIGSAFADKPTAIEVEGAAPINNAYWSPDGKILATTSADNTVRLWSSLTGQPIRTLKGHQGRVISLAWSPDGNILSSASLDSSVRGWDLATGETLFVLEGRQATSLAWSPDGLTLLTTTPDGTIILWDPSKSRVIQSIENPNLGRVTAASWAPLSDKIAFSTTSRSVMIITPKTDGAMVNLQGRPGQVWAFSWSPDGETIATASDSTIRIWGTHTGELVRSIEAHFASITSLAWSPTGQILASASSDSTVQFWNPATGDHVRTLKGLTRKVTALAWDPNGAVLAAVTSDSSVSLWDSQSGDQVCVLRRTFDEVDLAEWSPVREAIAVVSGGKSVRVWDQSSGRLIAKLQGITRSVEFLTWAQDGSMIATASSDKKIRLYDPWDGAAIRTLRGHGGQITAMEWSPSGNVIVTASTDRTVRFWNPTNEEPIRSIRSKNYFVTALSWAPNGRVIAAAGTDKVVRIWHSETGKLIFTLSVQIGQITALAWSPDGTQISAVANGTIRFWSATTGKPLRTLKGKGLITSSGWSPDGQMFAASRDRYVQIWDTASGNLVKLLSGHKRTVVALAWSPDGNQILTNSEDNTVRVWDSNWEEIRTLVGHPGRVSSVKWSFDGATIATGSSVLMFHTDSATPDRIIAWDGESAAVVDHVLKTYHCEGNMLSSLWFSNGLRRFELGETSDLEALGIRRIS
jgi:WD40 repeat protein/3',5'-cyclic AMP phosphodiesterase CpdA